MMKITPKATHELTAVAWQPERDAAGMPIHGRVGYGIQSSYMAGAMCLRVQIGNDVKQAREGDYLVFSGGSLVEHLTPAAFDAKYDIVPEAAPAKVEAPLPPSEPPFVTHPHEPEPAKPVEEPAKPVEEPVHAEVHEEKATTGQ